MRKCYGLITQSPVSRNESRGFCLLVIMHTEIKNNHIDIVSFLRSVFEGTEGTIKKGPLLLLPEAEADSD